MKKYILAIDQGTTSSRAVLADSTNLQVIDHAGFEYPQIYPQASWVEHDLNDIWHSVEKSVLALLHKTQIASSQIVGIGITNQRETTCAYNKQGEPLAHAIVWQDKRTSDYCSKQKKYSDFFKQKTGLPLDPYFSATKMKWLLENNALVKEAYQKNDLCLSTIDSFLLYKLTNAQSFATDTTNASRTLLFNLETKSWDEELCAFFNIKSNVLPAIQNSFSFFGKTSHCSFLPDGIPIHAILGDQQSALFGQGCFLPGETKCTYGTGAFLLKNTGEKIVHSQKGLLTTVAFSDESKTYYALEGSSFIAGAAVSWLRDQLNLIKKSSEINDLANQSDIYKCQDIFFFPYFSGIGSPYWNAGAKASIHGLSRDSGKNEIAYACLEGIAMSVNDLVHTMDQEFSHAATANSLNVDGGACANDLMMQMQASISNKKIIRPQNIETTALGVILGVHYFQSKKSLEEIKKNLQIDKVFLNDEKNSNYYQNKKRRWGKLIEKLYLTED